MNKTATWLTLAVVLVGGFEGLRQATYSDMANVPTICYGETLNVRYGELRTKAECDELLAQRLQQFYHEIAPCLPDNLPETRKAAFVSMAYNVGSSAFCKSSVARYAMAGDVQASCDSMLRWNRVNGVEVKGLTNRRKAERDLCLR